jgi:hypothetical protein
MNTAIDQGPRRRKCLLNNDQRKYWVATHRTGRPCGYFCGRNAKRDAQRLAKSLGGQVFSKKGGAI